MSTGAGGRFVVVAASDEDESPGRIGLRPAALRQLGLEDGDPISIAGRRVTAGRVRALELGEPPGDDLPDPVALDRTTRENADAEPGSTVTVEPVEPSPAEEVVLRARSLRPREAELSDVARRLEERILVAGDRIGGTLDGGRAVDLRVLRTSPDGGPVVFHAATRLLLDEDRDEGRRRVSWEEIGGLQPQLRRLREMIELPLRSPEVFVRLGIDAPKGVLLHGPPGCGKTLIARAVASESEAAFFPVSGPEIVHKFYGESEAHLRNLFDQAARAAPSIVFLDEIDAIAPRRDRTTGEAEKRLVAQLLAVMDGLARRQQVLVIGATNLPDVLDPALRRPGRFDREIAIPVPDRPGRREIVGVHSRSMPLASDVDLDLLAEITHGFVGADLEALCREAAMVRLRRLDVEPGEPISSEVLESLEVHGGDFLVALREVQPSALREVAIEVPEVPWEAVGGLDEVKERLRTLFVWPLHHPGLLEAAAVRPARGVLLHGPPGCGKTLLARAMATESGVNFLAVQGPELLAMHVGESEARLREVFRKARQAAPAILFFDEIDALLPRRDSDRGGSGVTERVLGQFLAELDGIEELRDVLVLAATNRLDLVDPALLRPGRFDELLEVPLPDAGARRSILGRLLGTRRREPGVDVDELVRATVGASGAVLAEIVRRATLRAVGRLLEEAGARVPGARVPGARVPGAREPDPRRLVLRAADLEEARRNILELGKPERSRGDAEGTS